ncbi:hypothetical protein V5O48_017590 [Marasmius crinis-equi]|uniref:Globin-sensor domain-containing protein n=1 Tax=Marasmius crinis-equi TaxID=585013 RepID=A0ABR3ENR5_9AGAR
MSSTDTLIDNANSGCPFKAQVNEALTSTTTIRPTGTISPPPASESGSEDSYVPPSPKKSCPVVMCQEIDENLLRKHLPSRIAYLTDYLNFGTDDAEAISEVAPMVHEVIPEMVDGMYAKLFEFDVTKRIFLQRNQGFAGELPKRLEDLTLDSPQIVFRKVFMKSWARRVLTADYTSDTTWAYMDKVGIMHTGASPFKHQKALGIAPLNVPYRDCALMLGHVLEVLQTAVFSIPESKIPLQNKIRAVNAINKVIWIQNDLFSRHYIKE